jgi:hypothetical protein
MKRCLLALAVCFAVVATGAAQQSAADTPATKEDVQRYLDVMHSRKMIDQMMDAMLKPMHQMIHEQYLKDEDKLPADFEARMSKMTDEMLKGFPWDEMIQAIVPVFQKHMTKGDIDAIVAFYATPTGQKLLKEMPVMMAEEMEAMMPLLRKQMDVVMERVQQQVAEMLKDSGTKPGDKPQASPN